MISKSSNIARRAKRVVDVAEAEMENSLDPDYAAKMAAAKDNLGQCETKVFHALTLLFNCLHSNIRIHILHTLFHGLMIIPFFS